MNAVEKTDRACEQARPTPIIARRRQLRAHGGSDGPYSADDRAPMIGAGAVAVRAPDRTRKHRAARIGHTLTAIAIVLLIAACNPSPRRASEPMIAPTVATLSGGTESVWRPALVTSWQIQYAALPVDLSVVADIYDIDLFDNGPDVIVTLHGAGRKVVCYFSAGSYEPYRADADQFPSAIRGKPIEGFEDEQWLDIRQLDVLAPIMQARLDLAKQRSCDGVDPDNVDGYSNRTGFPLTAQDQLAYNRWLTEEAHARGLAIGLKNDGDQAADLVATFDWAVVEQCFEYDECEQYLPFIQAGKPVFEIEYNREPGAFCGEANALNFNSLHKHVNLDGYRVACR